MYIREVIPEQFRVDLEPVIEKPVLGTKRVIVNLFWINLFLRTRR